MAELKAKYQQYAEHKNSGVEWLGEIPSHWEVVPIKHLAVLNPKKSTLSQDLMTKECSFVPMEKLKFNSLVLDEKKVIKDVYDGYTYFENEDILVAKVTPCFENNNTTIAKDLINGVGFGSSEIFVLRVDNKVNNRYLFYRLLETIFVSVATAAMTGAGGLRRVPAETINTYSIAVPDINEQNQIANFLDFETAQIDTLIEKQQTLIQLLKEKRQAVISHAVTPNKNEKSAKLGYFIDLLSGYSFPSNGYQTEPQGNIALLRGINVGVGTLKWDETVWWSRTNRDRLDLFELKEGDIVFGMDRPWISAGARVAEVTKADLPCLLLQRVIRIRANKGTYQPFIKLCLSSKEFEFSVEADLTGVSVPHLSPDQVKSFPIRDIGYNQQKTITDNVLKEIRVLDLIEENAEQAIQLMQERRTALISAAVTGKIDVRGWVAPDNA